MMARFTGWITVSFFKGSRVESGRIRKCWKIQGVESGRVPGGGFQVSRVLGPVTLLTQSGLTRTKPLDERTLFLATLRTPPHYDLEEGLIQAQVSHCGSLLTRQIPRCH